MTSLGASPTPSLTMARSLPQGVDELGLMGPFELFRSQLEDGSTEAKVDAMKRLAIVAFALGSEATSVQLIPYLQSNIAMRQPPHEDEMLLILAQQLQLLVPVLLSEPAKVLQLLPIVERLATMEETVVREEAVKCCNHICGYMDDKAQLVSMAKRLCSAEWFTAKVSAAGMMYKIFEATQEEELRYLYRDLCTDETPMVRRAAAKHLGKFLKALDDLPKVQALQPILEGLCKDEQDSVRLLAVASLSDIGDAYPEEWCTVALIPLVRSGSTDLSWRVRNHLAKVFSTVALNLNIEGKEGPQTTVMSCFVALLQDQESDVRASAVTHLAKMVHWGGAALFAQKLQALLPALADDVVVDVRSKCALALMDSSEGGTLDDATIVKAFTPLLENFLQDEYPEVQLHVLGNLNRISHLLTQMNGVVSSILSMSKAINWRVRRGVATLMPYLAEARGMDFFSSVLLEPAWLALLWDNVAEVRGACISGLQQLVDVAGDDWIIQTLLPQHVKIFDHASTSYLMRITILKGHTQIALRAKSGPLFEQVLLELLRGVADRVPNVRMVGLQGIHEIATCDGVDSEFLGGQIKAALEAAIKVEEDIDCIHFCELSLEAV